MTSRRRAKSKTAKPLSEAGLRQMVRGANVQCGSNAEAEAAARAVGASLAAARANVQAVAGPGSRALGPQEVLAAILVGGDEVTRAMQAAKEAAGRMWN